MFCALGRASRERVLYRRIRVERAIMAPTSISIAFSRQSLMFLRKLRRSNYRKAVILFSRVLHSIPCTCENQYLVTVSHCHSDLVVQACHN